MVALFFWKKKGFSIFKFHFPSYKRNNPFPLLIGPGPVEATLEGGCVENGLKYQDLNDCIPESGELFVAPLLLAF